MKNRHSLLIKQFTILLIGIASGVYISDTGTIQKIAIVSLSIFWVLYIFVLPPLYKLVHYKDETETIADLQKFVDECEEWANMVFPHANSESCIRHLNEELGEILELISIHQASHIDHEDIEKQEFADSMLLHLQAIKRRDISLTDLIAAMRKKMEINRQRKWKKTENGYWKHTL